MKVKELIPVIGIDGVTILIPQDAGSERPALDKMLKLTERLGRMDTAAKLVKVPSQYKQHVIANWTASSDSRHYQGLPLYMNESAQDEVLEMDVETVLTHRVEYERDMVCIVVKR